MGRTVGEIKANMTIKEYNYWIEFYKISPFGLKIEQYMSAQQSFITAKVSGVKNIKIRQFLPQPIKDKSSSFAAFQLELVKNAKMRKQFKKIS